MWTLLPLPEPQIKGKPAVCVSLMQAALLPFPHATPLERRASGTQTSSWPCSLLWSSGWVGAARSEQLDWRSIHVRAAVGSAGQRLRGIGDERIDVVT